MTVVRELTEQEQAVVQKYRGRYAAAIQQVQNVRESLDDLAAVLAPEEGHVLDVDNMRIVEQSGPELVDDDGDGDE